MMSSPLEIGRGINDSFNFISRVTDECDRLTKLIKEEISKMLLCSSLTNLYRTYGAWSDFYTTNESGWLCIEHGMSLPIIRRPKRSVSGYLFVQLSLAGNGIEAINNQEPLVHIGWWTSPPTPESTMGFPISVDPNYPHTLEDERLFRWNAVGVSSTGEWCYSVRLTDINRPEDVEKHLINPLRSLLLGDSPAAALSHAAAVKYIGLQELGQYRVLPRLGVSS